MVAGAEAFFHPGGPVGILLLHGFTGSPAALAPMGTWLHHRGYTVACPRYPGHGTTEGDLAATRWEDWAAEAMRALEDLARRCDAVVLCGLSFGGAMALHLAARRPDLAGGVVAVNPYVRDSRLRIAPVARFVLRSVGGVANDISKPGQDEVAYLRIPVAATFQVWRFFRVLKMDLRTMRLPLLLLVSDVDHVVPKRTAAWLLGAVPARDTAMIRLRRSFHVATLDHDAEAVFEATDEFVRAHASPAGAVTPPG
ncbi:MAG: alpha/beta fold hydrolase [Actinomycetota bacterium]|nr:alpha/beta fold hydrolase [Actinomycetota bacterium]